MTKIMQPKPELVDGKSPVQIVKDIHAAVLSSADHCVSAAKKIIGDAGTTQVEEMRRIAELNFPNAPEVIKAREFMKQHGLALEKAKIAEQFKFRYPTYKYIFREDMEKICMDYGLVIGHGKDYKGDQGIGIPDFALRQIIKFQLHPEDELYWKGTWKHLEGSADVTFGNKIKRQGYYDWIEIGKDEYMEKTSNGTDLISKNELTAYACNRNYMTIAAPASFFNTEGKVVINNELVDVKEISFPGFDPVCLQPVKFGFLILAVWGEEIAIKQLQNEKLN